MFWCDCRRTDSGSSCLDVCRGPGNRRRRSHQFDSVQQARINKIVLTDNVLRAADEADYDPVWVRNPPPALLTRAHTTRTYATATHARMRLSDDACRKGNESLVVGPFRI